VVAEDRAPVDLELEGAPKRPDEARRTA